MDLFSLWVYGESFDPDSFQIESSWKPVEVWHRLSSDAVQSGDRQEPHSGFKVLIGDGAELSTDAQNEAAVRFLAEHEDDLKRLQAAGDTTRLLGIEVRTAREQDACVFSVTPSAELLEQLVRLDVGIEFFIVRHDG